MKIVCVIAPTQTESEIILKYLQANGLKPLPKGTNSSNDIQLWHRELIKSIGEDFIIKNNTLTLGHLWEKLVTNIFSLMLDDEFWGWACSEAVWLLDFWKVFDHRLVFLLATEKPEYFIAKNYMNSENLDLKKEIDKWKLIHEQMLRFHLRNEDRSLLFDLEEFFNSPSTLLQKCVEKWSLPFNYNNVTPTDSGDLLITRETLTAPILINLIIKKEHPECITLYEEIKTSAIKLSEENIEILEDELINYKNILLSLQELHKLKQSLEALRNEKKDIERDRAEKEKLLAEKEQRIAEIEKVIVEKEEKTRELTEENELLVLQLHQIQEELETQFLAYQKIKQEMDERERELEEVKKTLDNANMRALNILTVFENLSDDYREVLKAIENKMYELGRRNEQ